MKLGKIIGLWLLVILFGSILSFAFNLDIVSGGGNFIGDLFAIGIISLIFSIPALILFSITIHQLKSTKDLSIPTKVGIGIGTHLLLTFITFYVVQEALEELNTLRNGMLVSGSIIWGLAMFSDWTKLAEKDVSINKSKEVDEEF